MAIDEKQLINGLWYSPYMKIYSIGGDERVMELSTYPRAFKQIYTETFTDEETGEQRTAKSWHWVESESLAATSFKTGVHEFPIVLEAIKGQLVNMQLLEAEIMISGKWQAIPSEKIAYFWSQIDSRALSLLKLSKDSDKQIIRVKYRRIIRGQA